VILLNRTCFGKLDNALAYFPRVTLGEKLPAYVLAGLIIFLGIQPNWLVKWAEPTATAMIAALPLQPQRLMDGDHQPVMPELPSTYAMASSLIVTGRPLQGPPPWAGGPDRSSMDFNRDGG
jgi:hypothetical protein